MQARGHIHDGVLDSLLVPCGDNRLYCCLLPSTPPCCNPHRFPSSYQFPFPQKEDPVAQGICVFFWLGLENEEVNIKRNLATWLRRATGQACKGHFPPWTRLFPLSSLKYRLLLPFTQSRPQHTRTSNFLLFYFIFGFLYFFSAPYSNSHLSRPYSPIPLFQWLALAPIIRLSICLAFLFYFLLAFVPRRLDSCFGRLVSSPS
jgi:hypothetical protein